ncbi:MAG: hypothetical protein VR65_24830 [Desulfobulbaceae bacterium BRH_c16a]|nr:MAG: hypothetical protein VR65_24830 [Desulfobulbaceae bacterium BRH_c16a]
MERTSVLIVLLLALSGCSPYLGKTVNLSRGNFCYKTTDRCEIGNKTLSTSYSIKKNGDHYDIDGIATIKSSAGSEFRQASFTLLLIKDNIVVDEVGMMGGNWTLDNTVSFRGSFAENGFEYSTLAYHFLAR